MLVPFAPILTLCVFIQSLLLSSLDYQEASEAFRLGAYFLLGSNTAYVLTGRMTLLDGLLDVQYIEPPVTPYPNSPSLHQISPSPSPVQSYGTWVYSIAVPTPVPTAVPTPVPTAVSTPVLTAVSTPVLTVVPTPLPSLSYHHPVSAKPPPVVVDACPAYITSVPDTGSSVDEARLSVHVSPLEDAPADSAPIDTLADETQPETKIESTSSHFYLPPLSSLIVRALDSRYAGSIALGFCVFLALSVTGLYLRVTRRSVATQLHTAEPIHCGHEDMIQDVRRLLVQFGADENISLAEFRHNLRSIVENQCGASQFGSPVLTQSSSYSHSPLGNNECARKQVAPFGGLPTPDPSRAGQQSNGSHPGPSVIPTGDSLDSFASFNPPTASSPARTISRAAPHLPTSSSLVKSASWSSFPVPRSTAPDVIDRMNENRSAFFEHLFKRLDNLGSDSMERSVRFSEDPRMSPASPSESDGFGSSCRYRAPTPHPGRKRAFGTRFLKLMEISNVEPRAEVTPYQEAIGTDLSIGSPTPQASHVEQGHTPEDKIEPLQQKPFMALVTGKLQQLSWIPTYVTCVMVLLMAVGAVPMGPASSLVLT